MEQNYCLRVGAKFSAWLLHLVCTGEEGQEARFQNCLDLTVKHLQTVIALKNLLKPPILAKN